MPAADQPAEQTTSSSSRPGDEVITHILSIILSSLPSSICLYIVQAGNEMEGFVVGCRVREVGALTEEFGARGTVRYIGPVAAAKNKKEPWLGVEWDQERGRHDGSCVDEEGNLHRYFNCANGFGSFVKCSKVTSGSMLITALRERYVSLDAPEIVGPENILPDAYVVTAKGHQKSIEFVGEKKLRRWQQIEDANKVALRNESVSTIGTGIAEVAANITEVDLQDNLLWQWKEITSLTSQLPGLSTLLLHGNKLQPLTTDIIDTLPKDSLQGLRVLALNSCDIQSWSAVELLEPLLLSIEELYLAANNLADVPNLEPDAPPDTPPDTVFNPPLLTSPTININAFVTLRMLDLSSCGLYDWNQVLAFRTLPALREIVLDSNPLSSVLPCPPGGFAHLQRFSISSSQLASWKDVDALASYESCCVLRLSQVPLFAGKGSSEVRPIIVGRLQRLQFFNGSTISPRERTDAEKAYLRSIMYALDDAAAAGTTYDVHALHPRYGEIQAKYGADMVPMGKASQGDSIAANLVAITFKNLSFGSGGSLEPTTKKLPTSLTVGRLRQMVKQLFGLDPPLQHLSIRVYKDAVPTLLEDDMASLSYYGAVDGAEVFINEAKDVK